MTLYTTAQVAAPRGWRNRKETTVTIEEFRAEMLRRHAVPDAQTAWEVGTRDAIIDRAIGWLLPPDHFQVLDEYARGYLGEATQTPAPRGWRDADDGQCHDPDAEVNVSSSDDFRRQWYDE